MAEISVTGGGVPSLTNTLTDTHIFVGDSNNEPADVALTLSATGGTFALANTGVLTMPNADAVTRGLLTAADWNTFNNKQNAIADWTTAFNSGTQATSSWSATNAAANVNAAVIPKGTGALTAQIPDGTFVGGNARGINAVDFQRIRPSFAGGARVASGERSFIGNGNGNSVSGTNSGVLCGDSNNVDGGNSGIVSGTNNSISGGDKRSFIGSGLFNAISSFPSSVGIVSGQSNTANANHAFIGGGQSNTASGQWSSVIGGQSNTASGLWSSVTGGQSNTASGSYSSVVGSNAVSNLYGQTAHASGQFSAVGDAQAHELVWRIAITGAVQTELFLDGASVAAILPANNTTWHGIIDISAICTVQGVGTTVVGDVAATSYKVTIKRIGINTSLVGSVQEIGTTNSNTSMSTSVFTIDNNDTNESLRVRFTPPITAGADTVIRCLATFRGLQIKY